MEEVSGIPGSLPALVDYPSANIRSTLPTEEWQICLDSWIFCIEFRLRLTDNHFEHLKLSHRSSGYHFVSSYFLETAQVERKRHKITLAPREQRLRRLSFFLLRRLLLVTRTPLDVSSSRLYHTLSDVSDVFRQSPVWRETVQLVWKRHQTLLTTAISEARHNVIEALQRRDDTSTQKILNAATSMSRTLPEAGTVFMTGSDYIEALNTAYQNHQSKLFQMAIVENTFISFMSLMSTTNSYTSLLLDHLYLLKNDVQQVKASSPSLLSHLVVATSFLRQLDVHISQNPQKRGQQLLEWLKAYREEMSHFHPIEGPHPSARRKGKAKAADKGNHEMHMHQAEKVSQITELFPDVSEDYAMRLLDHFRDNGEDVIAALLEPESLPPKLKEANTDDLASNPVTSTERPDRELMPRARHQQLATFATPRKNVYDDDALDRLQVSARQLHLGKKSLEDDHVTVDDHARSKAAILSALSAFDEDDDERDDTYDATDVGGTVDNSIDTDERPISNDEILYSAWSSDSSLFTRDSKTRLAQPRQQLKSQTGMTDEQIEGWALMLSRDENLQVKLKQRFAASSVFAGSQKILASTKWRHNEQLGSEDESGSGPETAGSSDSRRQGLAGIRGHRNFARGGRGGGTTGGDANLESTQAARRRKEQGRGRGGANHRRQEGRAKKMARGMAGPAPS